MQDMILERDMEKSATMHYDILNALREKDLDTARNYLRRHILSLHGAETVA